MERILAEGIAAPLGASIDVRVANAHRRCDAAGVVRVVSAEQIDRARFPLRDIYDLVLAGFALHARGEYEMPPKPGVHSRPGAFMHAMPAYLPTRGLMGAKLVSVYPDNPALGLPATTGVIVLMSPDTGIVSDVVDAGWITNVRTAMVSMVDARLLAARADPVFGIVGATGQCGRAHIEAIAEMFPGSRVLVNSRSRERCEALLGEFQGLPLELVVQPDHEAVVRECDVLIVTTSYLAQPLFRPEWLHAGQNVINVHARGWPADITAGVDRVSCDDRRQILDPSNGLTGKYPQLNPDFELGEVVVGRHPGRESDEHTIFSFNFGLAIFDLLVADYVLQRV